MDRPAGRGFVRRKGTPMRRTALVAVLAAAAVALLTSCTPHPVPLAYDGDTGITTSQAEWRVAPVTTSKGPGIEIRFRNCSTVVITADSLDGPVKAHLRPVARVTDSKGTVLFTNASPIAEVRPAGSQVIDTTTPDTDDLQRIIVPTGAAKGAITVDPLCTSYPGYGSGPGYTFDLVPCTTTTRSCATRTAGTGTFRG